MKIRKRRLRSKKERDLRCWGGDASGGVPVCYENPEGVGLVRKKKGICGAGAVMPPAACRFVCVGGTGREKRGCPLFLFAGDRRGSKERRV